MLKYGMKYSTIKYYQDEAFRLQQMVGSDWAYSILKTVSRDIQGESNRQIAHDMIRIARVVSPSTIKMYLN